MVPFTAHSKYGTSTHTKHASLSSLCLLVGKSGNEDAPAIRVCGVGHRAHHIQAQGHQHWAPEQVSWPLYKCRRVSASVFTSHTHRHLDIFDLVRGDDEREMATRLGVVSSHVCCVCVLPKLCVDVATVTVSMLEASSSHFLPPPLMLNLAVASPAPPPAPPHSPSLSPPASQVLQIPSFSARSTAWHTTTSSRPSPMLASCQVGHMSIT